MYTHDGTACKYTKFTHQTNVSLLKVIICSQNWQNKQQKLPTTMTEKLGYETAGVYLPVYKFKCLCYENELEQARHQRCVVRCKNMIIIHWVTLQWKPLNMNISIFKHFLWSSRWVFLWESLGDTPSRSSTGTGSALGGETGAAGAAGVGATGATAGATNESIWERERIWGDFVANFIANTSSLMCNCESRTVLKNIN